MNQEPTSRLIKQKGPRLSPWQKHLLERADDDNQWGGSASLRPRRQDTMSRELFRIVFVFNIPFSLVGLSLIGFVLAWVWFGDSGNPLHSISRPAFFLPFILGIATFAVLVSYVSTALFRRSWDKRARILATEE